MITEKGRGMESESDIDQRNEDMVGTAVDTAVGLAAGIVDEIWTEQNGIEGIGDVDRSKITALLEETYEE